MIKSITAYAKVNPVLRVLDIENGLHRLDTVILPLEFGDIVRVSARADKTSTVRITNGAQFANNNALLMAEKVSSYYGTNGVDIEIEKRIPVGAGLGGSSADAAAVMRAMQNIYALKDPTGAFLLSVGSDVFAQYKATPVRLVGVGAEVSCITDMPTFYVAVLVGGGANLTKDVFSRYDIGGGVNGDVDAFLKATAKEEEFLPFNALESAANSPLKEVKIALLKKAGFTMIGMTGSGSSYVAYSYQPIERNVVAMLEKEATVAGLTLIMTKTLDSRGDTK